MRFVPAYLRLHENGELNRRAARGLEMLRSCRVCPRDCDVDRLLDQKAVCLTGRYAVVASYFPHFGEEDCLRGHRGSGTIFFANCNLKCVFCQNYDNGRRGASGATYPNVGKRKSPKSPVFQGFTRDRGFRPGALGSASSGVVGGEVVAER